MEFTTAQQFEGFLSTSEIFTENAIFDYSLYRTTGFTAGKNLPAVPAPTATVLGKRMEHFFACYVAHFTSEDVVLQNQQIIQEKKTLGEMCLLNQIVFSLKTHVVCTQMACLTRHTKYIWL